MDRCAEGIENGELGAQFKGIETDFEEAHEREIAQVADCNQADVEDDDENVEGNQVAHISFHEFRVATEECLVLEVAGSCADVEDADDGLLDEEGGNFELVPEERYSPELGEDGRLFSGDPNHDRAEAEDNSSEDDHVEDEADGAFVAEHQAQASVEHDGMRHDEDAPEQGNENDSRIFKLESNVSNLQRV